MASASKVAKGWSGSTATAFVTFTVHSDGGLSTVNGAVETVMEVAVAAVGVIVKLAVAPVAVLVTQLKTTVGGFAVAVVPRKFSPEIVTGTTPGDSMDCGVMP